MRRGLSFCLMLVMILTVVWVPVSAEEQVAKIEIRTPSTLPKAGEEFEVVAYISNSMALNIFKLSLFAENDKFECIEMEAGEVFESANACAMNPESPVGALITVISAYPIDVNGLAVKYKFVANEDVAAFDFKVCSVRVFNGKTKDLPYEIIGATEVVAEQPSSEPEKDEETEEVAETPPVTEHLFADSSGHWAEWYINSAADAGLFKGDSDGNFYPDQDVTRAQFVTVLWRMAGSPSADTATPFTDIDGQIDEFKSAIAWGYTNGFINGTSETTFDPDGPLTREAAMKILHAYSGGKSGMELMFASVYNGHFEDSDSISSWAKSSMWWAVYYELISGTSKSTISPQVPTTRAQLAKILVNYINSTHIN